SHEVVLTRLLHDLGIPSSAKRFHRGSRPGELPATLEIIAHSRWPTRLAAQTVETALALPVPSTRIIEDVPRKRASIVVVTHNGLAYTKSCLASLFAGGWQARDELVIVDNASTDGTLGFLGELRHQNPFVRIFSNQDNKGFAAATNRGLAEASADIL